MRVVPYRARWCRLRGCLAACSEMRRARKWPGSRMLSFAGTPAAAHPPVVGIQVSAEKGLVFVAARDLMFALNGVRLQSSKLVVQLATRRQGYVALVREVLDR
jgi:hypothetical protein